MNGLRNNGTLLDWLSVYGVTGGLRQPRISLTMGKARHDRLHADRKNVSWESMPDDYLNEMMREAAVDLLAFARVLGPALW
jgi:hypothetical protein